MTNIVDLFKPLTYIEWFRRQLQSETGRQRLIAVAGVVGAIAIAAGAWWVYEAMTTIPAPDIKNAAPERVSEFLGSPRGFAHMPAKQQRDYLAQVMTTYAEPEKKAELAKAMSRMTTEEKVTLRSAVWDAGYDTISQEVDVYLRKPVEEQAEFVDRKIFEYHRIARYFVGDRDSRASGGEPVLVDQSFGAGLPTDSDGITKVIISKTHPEDRARMKPYVDAIRSRMLELKKDPKERERLMARYENLPLVGRGG